MNRLVSTLLWILSGAVCVFLIVPVLVVIPLSFNPEPYFSFTRKMLTLDPAGWSLRWYREIALNPQWQLAFRNSILIAAVVTPAATLLGTLAAFGLRRLPVRHKGIVAIVLSSPLIVPIIIFATGSYLFLAPLGLTQSFIGIILAHIALAAPYVVVTVGGALATFDERLLRAASILGSNPLAAFWRVTMPLMAPGMLAGALFAFITSFDEAVVALFLAGYDQKTVPLQMWSGMRDQLSPAVLAAATLLIVVVAVAMAFIAFIRGTIAPARTS
ncbi:ABC transporter permease [Labrys neptuniae]